MLSDKDITEISRKGGDVISFFDPDEEDITKMPFKAHRTESVNDELYAFGHSLKSVLDN